MPCISHVFITCFILLRISSVLPLCLPLGTLYTPFIPSVLTFTYVLFYFFSPSHLFMYIWLRTGTRGGTCKHDNKPSVSIKCGRISWPAEELLASQEGLCSMELVYLYMSLLYFMWRFTFFFPLAPSFRSILYISLQRLSAAERQVHPIVRPLQRILPHFCVGHTERRAVQLYVFTNIWLWSLNIAKFFLIKYKLVYTVFAAATNVTSSHTITFAQLENWTKRDFCFSLSWSPVVKRILLYCVLV